MSYSIVDHDVTPFSPPEHAEEWLRKVDAMLAERPDDDGLKAVRQELLKLLAMIRRERE